MIRLAKEISLTFFFFSPRTVPFFKWTLNVYAQPERLNSKMRNRQVGIGGAFDISSHAIGIFLASLVLGRVNSRERECG